MDSINKTAIQELIEVVEMDYNNGVEISMKVFYGMLVKALVKERQQIEDAFVAGDERGTKEIPFNAEQYYSQTFKKDNYDVLGSSQTENEFQCCDNCDLPDACEDLGCAIKEGIRKTVEW